MSLEVKSSMNCFYLNNVHNKSGPPTLVVDIQKVQTIDKRIQFPVRGGPPRANFFIFPIQT